MTKVAKPFFDDWVSLEDFEVTPDVNSIHCDTRDFHCNVCGDSIDIKDGKNRQISRRLHEDKYLISAYDIIKWLKGVRTIARCSRKDSWRCLVFGNVECDGWLKYIRLYRSPVNPGFFIVCNRNDVPIEWRNCTEENLYEELLHATEEREYPVSD